MTAQEEQTLYDAVGGKATVTKMVASFYSRVLNDTDLAPFFRDADMEKLRRMQEEFFNIALDGPTAYSGLSLSYAHQGRGIQRKHFARFVELMLDTLKELNVTEEQTQDIISRLNTYVDEVLSSGAGVGG